MMNKSLWIMRHAKSDWPDAIDDDLLRPLAKRGKKDAKTMGRWLALQEPKPQVILVSPAKRARATAKRVHKAFESCPIVVAEQLYGHSVLGYMQVIRNIGDDIDCAMLIGHNPDLEQLIVMLTGNIVAMTTSCIAHMNFEIADWNDIRENTGKLVHVSGRHLATSPQTAIEMS